MWQTTGAAAAHTPSDPMRTLVLLLTLLAMSAPPARGQAFLPTVSEFTLRPGDAVRITVWQKPDLSGEFAVVGSGTLAHPLYQEIPVVGVAPAELERRVRTFLSTFLEEPRFVVEPLLRISISGEIMRPTMYMLRPETTIAEALALAGGPTERGRADRVRVIRDSRERVIDLRAPRSGVVQERIRSGDELIVDRRRSVFRDYVTPTVAVIGATAAVVNVVRQSGR